MKVLPTASDLQKTLERLLALLSTIVSAGSGAAGSRSWTFGSMSR